MRVQKKPQKKCLFPDGMRNVPWRGVLAVGWCAEGAWRARQGVGSKKSPLEIIPGKRKEIGSEDRRFNAFLCPLPSSHRGIGVGPCAGKGMALVRLCFFWRGQRLNLFIFSFSWETRRGLTNRKERERTVCVAVVVVVSPMILLLPFFSEPFLWRIQHSHAGRAGRREEEGGRKKKVERLRKELCFRTSWAAASPCC